MKCFKVFLCGLFITSVGYASGGSLEELRRKAYNAALVGDYYKQYRLNKKIVGRDPDLVTNFAKLAQFEILKHLAHLENKKAEEERRQYNDWKNVDYETHFEVYSGHYRANLNLYNFGEKYRNYFNNEIGSRSFLSSMTFALRKIIQFEATMAAKKGDVTLTAKLNRELLEIDPNNKKALVSNLRLELIEAKRFGDYGKRNKLNREIMSIDPNTWKSKDKFLRHKAYSLIKDDDFFNAKKVFESRLNVVPKSEVEYRENIKAEIKRFSLISMDVRDRNNLWNVDEYCDEEYLLDGLSGYENKDFSVGVNGRRKSKRSSAAALKGIAKLHNMYQ